MTTIHATCGHCGNVRLDPDDVFVLMSSKTAMFDHCGTTQETPPIRDPFFLLALAVAGCMEADARDVEAALAGGRL